MMTLLDVYHTWKVLPMSPYMCYLCPHTPVTYVPSLYRWRKARMGVIKKTVVKLKN